MGERGSGVTPPSGLRQMTADNLIKSPTPVVGGWPSGYELLSGFLLQECWEGEIGSESRFGMCS